MPVCKFFLNGACKFGDRCKNEHPGANTNSNRNQNQHQSYNQRQPQNGGNRYDALGGHTVTPARNPSYSQSQGFASNQRNQPPKAQQPQSRNQQRNPRSNTYKITHATLDEDLRTERPGWIMSSYGPGLDPPIQMWGGFPLEQSMEEIRVEHYMAMAAGNPQQSAQVEAELAALANERVQSVLNDMDGAIDYIVKGADTHPNRLDMLQRPPEPARRGHHPFGKDRPNKPRYQPPNNPTASSGGFSGQRGMSNGVPQGWGQPPQNDFGASGMFGAPQQQNSGAFGQPIQPQQSGGGFGQPMQNQPSPAFGQPTQPQPGFGTPQMAPPFGQAQNNGMNGFAGQQPAFGQPQMIASPIPQDVQPGQQGFGQPPQQQQAGSIFGQPSPALSNGFGGQQQQASSFMQPQQIQSQAQAPQNNGFNTQNNSGFGKNAMQPQQTSQQEGVIIGFTQPQASTATPNADISTYTTRDNNGRLLTWKGARVNYIDNNACYQAPDGSWERIWFPDGAPAAQSWDPAAQGYPRDMTTAYEFLRQHGSFQGGMMPEMAPRHELIDWAV